MEEPVMTKVTRETVFEILAASHRVADGEVPLGPLIRKRRELGLEVSPGSMEIVLHYYKIAATLREVANVFGYYQMTKDENVEDFVVDCRTIHDLADAIEGL